MPLQPYRYWIFDMDGTLTLPIHDFEEIRAALGISSGIPILEAILEMPEAQADITRQKLNDIEMEIATRATPQPGITDVLQRLQDSGRRRGILTRNGEEITRVTLEAAGLDGYFAWESVIGRDSCLPKPNPDGVHRLLEIWNAASEETVIIGDYLYDIQAGREAGITTVHFDQTGLFPWPQYTDHRVESISDLGKLF